MPVIREGPSGTPIAHRIVAVLDDGRIVTRGDANAEEDQPVEPETILGVVKAVASPPAAFVLSLYTNPVIVFGAVGLFAVSMWIGDPTRRPRDDKDPSASDTQAPPTNHREKRDTNA